MTYVAAGTVLYAALVVLAALIGLAGEESVYEPLDHDASRRFTFDV